MEEMLIEKVSQQTFLYDTKSSDYRDQHIFFYIDIYNMLHYMVILHVPMFM